MVQTENVSVAIVEGSDKALEIGAVVGELYGFRYDQSVCCSSLLKYDMVWTVKLTFSKTVFCSVSVRGRILAVVV